MMEAIKITCGKDALNENEKEMINKLSVECKRKLERYLKDIISFEIHVKCHLKEGNVKRFRIDVRVKSPGFNFEASAEEFGLQDSVNEALKKIVNEVAHKTKIKK